MLIYKPDSPLSNAPSCKRALFLDRDGVINKEINYLHKIKDFEFIKEIFELCKSAGRHGYLIIVITNQSGIARDYYSENNFAKLTKWMMLEFSKHDIQIAGVYACPHLSNDCLGRKPNPGMLLQAQKDFDLDLSKSIFIGDQESDMEAGRRAEIGNLFLFTPKRPVNLFPGIDIISNLNQVSEKLFP